MFTPEEMIFTVFLIGLASCGTYYLARQKFLSIGVEIGTEMTIDTLIADGFLETEIDSDGDQSLVLIKNIKDRYREMYRDK